MTTINEALTPLGDGFRNLYGINDRLSAKDMTKLLSGVELHNFLAGNSFEATFKDKWISQNLVGPSIDDWNKYIAGKVVTFSCDAEWTGYKSGAPGDRFFFEFTTTDVNNQQHWNGLYFTPTTANGKQHLVSTSVIANTSIKSIDNVVFWDELNQGSHLKVTNIKMTVNPLGGVNSEIILNTTPDKEYSGKGYVLYSLSPIYLQPKATYELSLLGKVDQTASSFNQYVFTQVFKEDWSWATSVCKVPISTEYHRSTLIFSVPDNLTGTIWIAVYLSHGDNGNNATDKQRGTGYAKDIMIRRIFK